MLFGELMRVVGSTDIGEGEGAVPGLEVCEAQPMKKQIKPAEPILSCDIFPGL
jgi:hypothetical protein